MTDRTFDSIEAALSNLVEPVRPVETVESDQVEPVEQAEPTRVERSIDEVRRATDAVIRELEADGGGLDDVLLDVGYQVAVAKWERLSSTVAGDVLRKTGVFEVPRSLLVDAGLQEEATLLEEELDQGDQMIAGEVEIALWQEAIDTLVECESVVEEAVVTEAA